MLMDKLFMHEQDGPCRAHSRPLNTPTHPPTCRPCVPRPPRPSPPQVGRANLGGLWELFRRAVFSSQCEGRILTPALLIDALHSLLAPYAAEAERLLGLAGTYLAVACMGTVEGSMQALAERCERCEREAAGKVGPALLRVGGPVGEGACGASGQHDG